ncbi:hypothetical protein BASA50_005293 [Batrachochytrium salamandrivorans]|uniref:Hsp90 chaperone protein kinase-targeting subunit n=1 Tax=Batrachochytrium salamandrivorans TaxID=1357716 RepID=A0ABQ8FEJ0_9FUNG|nr:hypothetical protein BASA60_009637 [Batrachochytrium salamandrivorans]KAH6596250.1 hypothetical protein BASA50_005293 [Batrachochytrium salamandrivorans]KAH9272125.1 hypothetical protein BASA83_005716 [Batrachochytrium salamandrivorans]
MPIDYSKWDAIELSDDEDFDCHPNVDKKSMIRWKQAQVHKERRERQDQLDLLTLEHQTSARFIANFMDHVKSVFEGMSRPVTVAAISETLKTIQAETETTYTDPLRTKSMNCMNSWPREWEAPSWGTVLREHVPWHETVAKIEEAVAKIAVDRGTDNPESFIDLAMLMFAEAQSRLVQRQDVIAAQIKALRIEMNKKLTADHLKTGFDKTVVSKKQTEDPTTSVGSTSSSQSKAGSSLSTTTIETIHSPKSKAGMSSESAALAEVAACPGLAEQVMSEYNATDEDLAELHPELPAFTGYGDFGDVVRALKKHPKLQEEASEEAILMRALVLEIVGRAKEAKTCVVNSLILKYTRSLGTSGIDVFFDKLESGKSSAHALFFSDVTKTYEHIQRRGKILRMERIEAHKRASVGKAEHDAKIKDVYQTFLQPDGSLIFPLPDSPSERVLQISDWFNALPVYAKEGLLLEDVDKINDYLKTLDPKNAELSAQLAIEAGFIHVEDEEDEEDEKDEKDAKNKKEEKDEKDKKDKK